MGAIDASEMLTAFTVLGLRTKRSEIEEMLAEVDADGSGEVEYAEFVQIMTTKMDSQSQEQEAKNAQPGKAQPLPFPLLAQAYRRKKLMEAVMGGDKGTQERLQARAEEMEAERIAAIAEAEAQKRQVKKRPKTLSQVTRERIRRTARLKKQEADMPLEGYVMERIDQDVKNVLFGVHERASVRRSSMTAEEKAALEEKISQGKEAGDRDKRVSLTKSTTPVEKTGTAPETVPDSTEQQRAFSISKLEGGQIASLDSQLQRYYKEELKGISAIRSKLRDKPTLEQQKIRLRALHSLGNYQHDQTWEAQRGSPVETVEKMRAWDSILTPWRVSSPPIIPRRERSESHARIQFVAPPKPPKTRLTVKRPDWINNIHLGRP
ncbi:hypothetical protein MPTK1_3g16360 [Marchantia polymorpha subsp. ruderalis]|uniref:EF-hand domain-containing protein n=2 Tax=Marchantia polymorpha TaxID=3197 RepID=A0AAF6B1F7_MARPO|nr:hypothetical protein MARPO_0004s0035 [Marchantia polymorpha]BBN05841.1 hypothetical protein Mp_3g16360 [Marchantia polymorpha subsp. ruderalis]|eukprot:PTQ48737.1 hypothetical protein MARPO_0004s0035 [Marchantia polymorpha]